MDIKRLVVEHWGLQIHEATVLHSGLINQTFQVRTNTATYMLQQVNNQVFKTPELLQNQLLELSNKLKLTTLVPLEYIRTKKGKALVKNDNHYFRLLRAITPSLTLKVATPVNASLAAAALLDFHKALQSLQINDWKLPIAHFLEVSYRIKQFEHALTTADLNRKEQAQQLIDALKEVFSHLELWQQFLENEPKVLIHADPKLSNFLFHPNGKQVRALIDWDTIQLGSPYYDYADMIRSFCSWGEEISEQQTLFREDVFEALFGALGVNEQKLQLAVCGVILVQALRFLTDFLQNDVYYLTNDETHNLRRAANQLRLFQEFNAYWLTTRRPAQ